MYIYVAMNVCMHVLYPLASQLLKCNLQHYVYIKLIITLIYSLADKCGHSFTAMYVCMYILTYPAVSCDKVMIFYVLVIFIERTKFSALVETWLGKFALLLGISEGKSQQWIMQVFLLLLILWKIFYSWTRKV